MAVLKYYQEFKEILAKYSVSEEAERALKDLKLVLLLGPTSTGRNTTIRYLVETGRYHYIVSDTTRQPRTNDGVLEQNGREYWFKTEEEVLEGLKRGEYLEAELIHDQQISGISIRELEKAQSEQKTALKDLEIQGVHSVIRAKPDSVAIMLLPPSFEEWQRRLSSRGKMHSQELKRRLETAIRIFDDGLKQNYYHFVISDNVDRAAAAIDAIAEGKPNPQQGQGAGLIHRLQNDLNQKLESMKYDLA